MDFIEISKHKHWKNKEGVIITVIQTVNVKSPVSNSWLDGVLYKEGHNFCVRSAVDFIGVFEPYQLLDGEVL